jgi:PAS domain S-box-containing protein
VELPGEGVIIEREESLKNLWLFIIINTTVLALLINILALHFGTNDVAPYLLYIPVVIAAYWYPNKGPVFAIIITGVYLGIVYLFTSGSLSDIIPASIKCYVLIGVTVVVSSLASHMRQNEVKYRGLFNHSEAAIGLVNLSSLSILEVNQRFANLLGYKQDELPVISFADLWADPAHMDAFFMALKTVGSVENLETRFHTKVKSERWVLISAGKLLKDQFVCTIIDITDRKKAEEAVLIKDHAISSSINAIAIFDLDFTITYMNNSLIRMMEYSHEMELIGKNASQLIASAMAFEEIRSALQNNDSWFGEIVLLKFDKTPFYVLLWANLVTDEKGKPICIMVSFIDITDTKQLEMAKRQALEQIEKNIEQFAILGDHIRNPLAVIVGLSSLAPGDITEKIILQAREIDRIITQLDMGWIESEKVREFIKRYYMVGAEEMDDVDAKKRGSGESKYFQKAGR